MPAPRPRWPPPAWARKTLLLTHNIETLGQMSCNPSIGGIGKGHLVKEVDALGGAMALATDEAGIQFRILNSSKGPAVRATRAQADRVLYKAAIRRRLENQPNLSLFQQAVDDLMVEGDRVVGAVTQVGIALPGARGGADGRHLPGRQDPCRPGQLPGRPRRRSAGGQPVGPAEGAEAAAGPAEDRHAAAARRAQHRLLEVRRAAGRRHARRRRRPMPVFSFMGRADMHPAQMPCWITHTNERTHEIIRSGFDRSPMFTGKIEGVGPRYCPSVEDKINRFADKDSHQIFLEPEGLTTQRVLPERHLDQPAVRHPVRSWCARWPGWRTPTSCGPATPSSTTTSIRARCKTQLRDARDRGPVLCRADQRHHRLRRGRGAGPVRRHQRGAAVPGRGRLAAAARRGLPGRAGRRPDHQGRDRAVPHVHQPGRVPAAAARRQRRHAPDRSRAASWAWSTTRAGTPSAASATLFHVKQSGCKSIWVNPRNLPAAESERVLGKAIEHEYNLADLLRRPDVSYAALMSLDGGQVRRRVRRDAGQPIGGRADRDRRQVLRLHRPPAGRGRARRAFRESASCRPIWTTCRSRR